MCTHIHMATYSGGYLGKQFQGYIANYVYSFMRSILVRLHEKYIYFDIDPQILITT